MNEPVGYLWTNQGKTCSLCPKPAFKRGLCGGHLKRYYSARKAGTLDDSSWKRPMGQYLTSAISIRAKTRRSLLGEVERYAEFRGLGLNRAAGELLERGLATVRDRMEGQKTNELKADGWRQRQTFTEGATA